MERGKTQRELCVEVEKETGLKVDEAYLSNILNGRKSPPKVVNAIVKLLQMDEEDKTA